MTDETSLDIAGFGEVAKAIPAKAWTQIVDTACTSFRELIAPLTATTSGVGRLIEARFDRLVDAQKVLASETVSKATEKSANREFATPPTIKSARVVVAVIECSSSETDPLLRELWANLLATEFGSNAVHPEFPAILSKLSAQDAQVLAQIAKSSAGKNVQLLKTVNDIFAVFKVLGVQLRWREEKTFAHEHLETLHLISEDRGAFSLTLFGQEFLRTIAGDGASQI